MAKNEYILIDSNLIIGTLRGNENVKQILATFPPAVLCISEITLMEVLIGCNTVQKRNDVEQMLKAFHLVKTDEQVIAKTISLIKRYAVEVYKQQKTIMLADAIIAASALVHNLPLLTLIKKDFDFIRELTLNPLSY